MLGFVRRKVLETEWFPDSRVRYSFQRSQQMRSVMRTPSTNSTEAHPLVAGALGSLGLPLADQPVDELPRDRSKADAAVVAASQRWRLLMAVARVVADQGYAGATIEKVVAEAGVSKKTFYKFFASKEEAFLACYDGMDVILDHLTRIAQDQHDAETAVEAVWGAYLIALAAAPDLTRLFLIEALTASPRIRLKRAENLERFATVFRSGLAAFSSKDSRAAEQTQDDALALLGGINELCVRHISRHSVESLPDITPQLVAFTRRYFGLAGALGRFR